MKDLRGAGVSLRAIAAATDCSYQTVGNYTRGVVPAGRKHIAGWGLHPDDADREAEIVRRARAGETFASIAAVLGPSPERIRQIVVTYEKRTGEAVPRITERRHPKSPAPHLSVAQHLLRRATLVPLTGCWRWTGSLFRHRDRFDPGVGTGRRKIVGEQYAHRAAYRLWIGEIPEGCYVVWTCGSEPCVNPAHLKVIPRLDVFKSSPAWDEQRNMWKHTRPRERQSHCRRGHPLSGDNLYVAPKGVRQCKACRRLRYCARHPSA
jgi:DNA-binding CsgD family transcriptional regulator